MSGLARLPEPAPGLTLAAADIVPACRAALDYCETADEVQEVIRRARALEGYYGREREHRIACQLAIAEAERRLGEFLPGAGGDRNVSHPEGKSDTIGLALKKDTKTRARKLAAIPDEEWDATRPKVVAALEANPRRSAAKVAVRIAAAAREVETPPLPDGQYEVVLADPPWRYEHSATATRRIENQYPTMALAEIRELAVPAAPDSVLYLWATSPKLPEALDVMDAWGFRYVTCLVWVKDRIGMGYHARQRHELLLVGVRGAPGTPAPADRPDSVIEAARGRHSAKPAAVYDLIERAWPGGRRLEMFARASREGWDRWGG